VEAGSRRARSCSNVQPRCLLRKRRTWVRLATSTKLWDFSSAALPAATRWPDQRWNDSRRCSKPALGEEIAILNEDLPRHHYHRPHTTTTFISNRSSLTTSSTISSPLRYQATTRTLEIRLLSRPDAQNSYGSSNQMQP